MGQQKHRDNFYSWWRRGRAIHDLGIYEDSEKFGKLFIKPLDKFINVVYNIATGSGEKKINQRSPPKKLGHSKQHNAKVRVILHRCWRPAGGEPQYRERGRKPYEKQRDGPCLRYQAAREQKDDCPYCPPPGTESRPVYGKFTRGCRVYKP